MARHAQVTLKAEGYYDTEDSPMDMWLPSKRGRRVDSDDMQSDDIHEYTTVSQQDTMDVFMSLNCLHGLSYA